MMKQGDFILASSLRKQVDCDFEFFLVISHSCDISREEAKEPFIEVLPCHEISSLDYSCTCGKNVRECHITACIAGRKKSFFKIIPYEKEKILKGKALSVGSVSGMDLEEQPEMLPTWLALRYKRQALPDEINELFKAIKLKDYVKKQPLDLIGIWISYDPLFEDTKEGLAHTYIDYFITLYFVFDSEIPEAKNSTENLLKKISKRIKDRSIKPEFIDLESVSDINFSYEKLKDCQYINFDYLSC